MRRMLFALMISAILATTVPALAQQPVEATPEAQAGEALKVLVLEEVTVISGHYLWLKGAQAFAEGDYPEAEKHFTSLFNQIQPAVLLDPFTAGGGFGTNFFNSSSFFVPIIGFSTAKNLNSSGLPTRVGGVGQRSNKFIGVQGARLQFAFTSYWKGMAQIRQGDIESAKVSMMTAIRYNKSFHDARMRVGLINLLEGRPKLAKRRLTQLAGYCGGEPCRGEDKLSNAYTTLESAIDAYELAKS